MNLGNFNTNAYLRVDVLYWKSDKALESGYRDTYKLSDLATKVNVKYKIPCDKITPYAGVGLSVHKYILHYEWYGSTWDYDETKLGFHVFAGAEYPIWNQVYCFVEGAFDRSDRDQYFVISGVGYRIK